MWTIETTGSDKHEEGKFYVLPELLYAYNDLMPQISKEQKKLHHCARKCFCVVSMENVGLEPNIILTFCDHAPQPEN